MSYKAPEGTADMLPSVARMWRATTETAAKLFATYGYEPIDTPIFELTEVFCRGIGEATDVVGKEMFVVRSGENYKRSLAAGTDEGLKSKQKLSLRPEGTAGTVRAVVQHNLVEQGAAPVKLWYGGPMFRAERPQKGRLRQFHQIGVECLGATDPTADAEMIIMLMRFYETMGVPRDKMRLLINSMGDEACRPAYRESVRQFILEHEDEMCEECKRRAEINPLRAFDCKNETCSKIMEGAPRITDHLCEDCRAHYEAVKSLLDAAGVEYIEDSTLVRGLDYYTRTVFEVQVTEGLGFALGFERMVLALEAAGALTDVPKVVDIYMACVDASVRPVAFDLMCAARNAGLAVDMDHQSKSLKAQFKMADKLGARAVMILGPDEVAAGKAKVRNMQTHDEKLVDIVAMKQLLGQFGGQLVGGEGVPMSVEDIFSIENEE